MRARGRCGAVLAVVFAAALVACGSRSPEERTAERVKAAEARLEQHPRDANALAEVIRAAHAAAIERSDPGAGIFEPEARRFLDRAAAIWPRYVAATRDRPAPTVSAIMVDVLGRGLGRAPDAARAAEALAAARPTSSTYLTLAQWSARAGHRRATRLAGQKALELAEPGDRERVRAAIRLFEAGGA